MFKRTISAMIIAAFLLTQCGISFALRPTQDAEGKASGDVARAVGAAVGMSTDNPEQFELIFDRLKKLTYGPRAEKYIMTIILKTGQRLNWLRPDNFSPGMSLHYFTISGGDNIKLDEIAFMGTFHDASAWQAKQAPALNPSEASGLGPASAAGEAAEGEPEFATPEELLIKARENLAAARKKLRDFRVYEWPLDIRDGVRQHLVSVVSACRATVRMISAARDKIGLIVADKPEDASEAKSRLLAMNFGLRQENIRTAVTQKEIDALGRLEWDFLIDVTEKSKFNLPQAPLSFTDITDAIVKIRRWLSTTKTAV